MKRFAALAIAVLLASPAHASPITALAFSPDGSNLVTAGPRTLDVRSADGGAPLRHIPCPLPKVTDLKFAPHGRWFAVTGGTPGVEGNLLLIDPQDGRTILSLSHGTDLITAAAFDSRGGQLALAGSDRSARLLRLSPDGSRVIESLPLTGHSGPVFAVAFSPDDRWIVTGGADRTLTVWSAREARLERRLSQHTEAINALAFRPLARPADTASPTPVVCASGADDRTVRVWQPGTGRMVRVIRQHDGAILALAYATDGATLFTAGRDGIVRQFDAESDAQIAAWHDHADWILALAVSPDGSRLASADWAGALRVRRLPPARSP